MQDIYVDEHTGVNILMSIHTLEPAYHPANKMGFMIDWILTMKCNYDCAYCTITGHDNSTNHPKFERCLQMLDQLYAYTDVMMEQKKPAFKDAIMSIAGGEAVYHPRIVDLIKEATQRYEQYSDRWRLTKRMTTNGTASTKNWKVLCDYLDGFTMSYHSTGPEKLKQQFRTNLEHLAKIKKEHDIIVCMYPMYWQDCLDFLQYCKENKFNARPKLLDGPLGIYNEQQKQDLSAFLTDEDLATISTESRVDEQSRGCCGGRKMCMNRNTKEYQTMVPRGKDGFLGWHCSANQFFIHGNNSTEQYFTNKDCRTKLDGTTGAIANIDTMSEYTEQLRSKKEIPMLVCAQTKCVCGTCAPKSTSKESLASIMSIYNR